MENTEVKDPFLSVEKFASEIVRICKWVNEHGDLPKRIQPKESNVLGGSLGANFDALEKLIDQAFMCDMLKSQISARIRKIKKQVSMAWKCGTTSCLCNKEGTCDCHEFTVPKE